MARSGRKPKPAEAHERDGTRPSGAGSAPTPNLVSGRGRPDMPSGFDADMKRVWLAVVEDLEEGRVIDKADWPVIEVFCVEVARLRQARRVMLKTIRTDPVAKMSGGLLATGQKSAAVVSPLRTIEKDAGKSVASLADQLGLGPSGRARLGLSRKDGGRSLNQDAAASGVPESPRRLRALPGGA